MKWNDRIIYHQKVIVSQAWLLPTNEKVSTFFCYFSQPTCAKGSPRKLLLFTGTLAHHSLLHTSCQRPKTAPKTFVANSKETLPVTIRVFPSINYMMQFHGCSWECTGFIPSRWTEEPLKESRYTRMNTGRHHCWLILSPLN